MKVFYWNLLADSLTFDAGFQGVDPKHLAWEHRYPLLLEQIVKSGADLIALVEVDHPEKFQLVGYSSFYVKKNGTNVDGTLLLSRQQPISQGSLNLGTQNLVFFEMPNFFFGCVHLKAKPNFQHLREKQVGKILEFLQQTGKKWILTGDFNEIPINTPILMMKQFFTSVYPDTTITTSKTRSEKISRMIDYIFYDPQFFKLISREEIYPENFSSSGFLSEHFPSDHHFLTCIFE